MKHPTPSVVVAVPKNAPRVRTAHLIALGLGCAAACAAFFFSKPQTDIGRSLFAECYKDGLWVCGGWTVSATYRLLGTLSSRARMRIALLSTTVLGLSAGVWGQASPAVDQYVAKQSPIAKAGVLANIGSNGSRSSGAKVSSLLTRISISQNLTPPPLQPGVVIASPSTNDPDYLYTWSRDAALVYKSLIDQLTSGQDNSLRSLVDDYVSSQTILQQVSNPSGTVLTGGLGEPKFKINLEAFTDGWGRPQRDGPALRATAVVTYANWLVAQSNSTHVVQKLWPVIKLDLDYVANKWNSSGFDLWEEVSSASFFTTAVQHRALREGVTLAQKLGQTGVVSLWTTQADNILCFLQSYWNPTGSYITSNTQGGRSGIDANSALASIHTFDSAAGCDAVTFQPCSDKALASLKVYVDSFRSIYTINKGIAANRGVATGRYPEDVYYGGHPWYLTTAAAAEQLYDALIVWNAQKSLSVTSISLAFFRQFLPTVTAGTYASTTSTYTTLVNAIRAHADDFIAVNAKYTPADGSLAEQYNRENGVPLSAKHLTWSYASTLTAFAARKGDVAASWGAKGLKVPTGVCRDNPGPIVKATFNVVANTVFGENIYLTGSIDQLKNWSPDNALPLSAAGYPTWSITLDVPANTNFEYKFIRKNNGVVNWESDPNRQATTPATGSVVINGSWR
ncbi:hypothetical protein DXG03_007677 [Asterophora parasitica]|uniref:Glucoamylase n=1 Tax=Asterophora parasitica TaxID=117018 RepID=A0A9P7G6J0_9AGAR|nr:hypothetical protein DXG03_007677 [Asterophora parasitica]